MCVENGTTVKKFALIEKRQMSEIHKFGMVNRYQIRKRNQELAGDP